MTLVSVFLLDCMDKIEFFLCFSIILLIVPMECKFFWFNDPELIELVLSEKIKSGATPSNFSCIELDILLYQSQLMFDSVHNFLNIYFVPYFKYTPEYQRTLLLLNELTGDKG